MKILVWIGCFLVAAALQVFLGYAGIKGAIPSMAIFLAMCALANYFCKRYEEKRKKAAQNSRHDGNDIQRKEIQETCSIEDAVELSKINQKDKQMEDATARNSVDISNGPYEIKIEARPQIESGMYACPVVSKDVQKHTKFIPLGIIILLSTLLIVSLIFNIIQGVQNNNLSKVILDKDSRIERLESTLKSKAAEITRLQGNVSELSTEILERDKTIASFSSKSKHYDAICKELSSGNIGYCADNFKSDVGIVTVKRTMKAKKFNLTAYWKKGGTVSVSYSGNSARVDFDNESWSRKTSMTIRPQRAGVTAVTFSNDVDSKKFKVIIIVTD